MSNLDDPKVFIIEKRCDEKGMRITSFDKGLIAIIITLVVILIMLPMTFKLTNRGARVFKLRTTTDNGVPTSLGLLVHGIVLLIVIRLLMK